MKTGNNCPSASDEPCLNCPLLAETASRLFRAGATFTVSRAPMKFDCPYCRLACDIKGNTARSELPVEPIEPPGIQCGANGTCTSLVTEGGGTSGWPAACGCYTALAAEEKTPLKAAFLFAMSEPDSAIRTAGVPQRRNPVQSIFAPDFFTRVSQRGISFAM